jgi:hypothetical protein
MGPRQIGGSAVRTEVCRTETSRRSISLTRAARS